MESKQKGRKITQFIVSANVNGRSAKLLSYHPKTAVQLHMEGGNVVDGFYHLIFRSIAKNIMSWPFFLDLVSIDNDDEKEEKEV